MQKRIFIAVLLSLLVACGEQTVENSGESKATTFVGSERCIACHTDAGSDWRGSHHQLAMQEANDNTVLGDFNHRTHDYFGSETRFFKRDADFWVRTKNAAGDLQDFKVSHTFGVEPLQQYLVETDGGRKKALTIVWDSRAESDGGQRWYHLYPDEEIKHDDPLHWTGPYFTWNWMCAECHSTDLQLNYDRDSDSFNTTYSEISVGCESCHGPGSAHIVMAESGSFAPGHGLPVDLDDRSSGVWIMNAKTGIAELNVAGRTQQVDSCGRCHSRRSPVTTNYEYGQSLTQTHMPAFLDDGLYYADGRIRDEVYVYGSFLQSKMFAAGVTCSDCHNPHSGKLRAGPNPNNTCAQCHLPSRFAVVDHAATSTGDCVTCHMPATTYMGVDDRRDHSFRIPEAGLSSDHYGNAVSAGRKGGANQQLLNAIANSSYPSIARATLLTLLDPVDSEAAAAEFISHLDDPDPLIRVAALRALRGQPAQLKVQTGSHLLRDPDRSVRLEAVVTYADFRELLPLDDARAFAVGSVELRQSLNASSSMPEAAVMLGEFETSLGNSAAAADAYQHALKVGSNFASVQHAVGLHLVRAGQAQSALRHLQEAVRHDSTIGRYAFVLGVAMNSLGNTEEAIASLSAARITFPDDFDIAWALATMQRDDGQIEEARSLAAQMRQQFPDDDRVHALIEALGSD